MGRLTGGGRAESETPLDPTKPGLSVLPYTTLFPWRPWLRAMCDDGPDFHVLIFNPAGSSFQQSWGNADVLPETQINVRLPCTLS